nr:DNA repair protein RadC [Mammaliicoccus sp. Marseille-Q6498]
MAIKIRDLQNEDKPRERLKSYGSDKLTNRELLAIIINSGSKQFSSLECANQVLNLVSNLRELRHLTFSELITVNGIGEKKAITILAVIELAKRMHSNTVLDKVEINEPKDVANYLMEKLRYLKQEHFVALLLNTKNQIIHEQSIFIGSLNMAVVHPRDLLREAVKHSAASIVIAHNHPSGDPTPSLEDIKTTKRVMYCCDLMGIDLLDHIIIGDGEFVSLFQEDYIMKEDLDLNELNDL